MQTFGGRLRRIVFPDAATESDLFDEHFQTRNCIHSAALVRRETLFIPLSGRFRTWPPLSEFLERQPWPHEQIKLVLCDTSQDPEFSAVVRRRAAATDYPDVRIMTMTVGSAGGGRSGSTAA